MGALPTTFESVELDSILSLQFYRFLFLYLFGGHLVGYLHRSRAAFAQISETGDTRHPIGLFTSGNGLVA